MHRYTVPVVVLIEVTMPSEVEARAAACSVIAGSLPGHLGAEVSWWGPVVEMRDLDDVEITE